jgi:hypothetical protein
MEPIGTVYTDELDVPAQNISSFGAIPGVTPKVEWFGIDYYADFHVDAGGDYTLQLLADDAAKLFVDGNLLISMNSLHSVTAQEAKVHLEPGSHRLHLPYMQGPGGLALMLLIKPPGQTYRVFNLRDFSVPAEEF